VPGGADRVISALVGHAEDQGTRTNYLVADTIDIPVSANLLFDPITPWVNEVHGIGVRS
jgi:hypothetical protein